MKPILFRLPGLNVPVYGFGVMVVLAFYAAMAAAVWRSRREKLDPGVIYDLAVWMLVGGLVGARLFYVVEFWGTEVKTFADVFQVWNGGVVFYGGAIGGVAGFLLARRFQPFPLLATLDVLAPSIALGAGIGRLGCFLNGCCYGDVCDVPGLGVRFPAGSSPWRAEQARGLIPPEAAWSLPLHPTQLYSAVDGVVLFALLTAFYPLRRRDGEVAALLALSYSVSRFVIEWLRDDESARLGLTPSQWISLGLFAGGCAFGAWLRRCPAVRHVDAAAA